PPDFMRALLRPFLAGAAAAACAAGAVPAAAQSPDLGAEVTVGSEAERYLRVLQVGGEVPLYPWSVRGFSPGEVSRLLPADPSHPWADRVAGAAADSALLRLVRPQLDVVFNSAMPQGTNDGAVWAGRGLTASASAGVQFRAGPLSVRLEPLVYWSQNRDFRLVPNGRPDTAAFRDPRSPVYIDLPQRMDEGAFARLDPGQSTIRLDVRGFAVGFSTANQQWGPASDQPLLLGTNAGGFPHGFAGTSNPWKVGIGRVHGRLVWGSLHQSPYSPMPEGHGSRRFMSGISAVFLPYGLDGLEVGVARFYHQAWPRSGFDLSLLPRPLEAFWRNSLRFSDEAGLNQVASVFGRWVLPEGGVEVYGEFAREDHSFDYDDFILEPDRSSGYMLGGRKVWGTGRARRSFRAEWVNTQPGHLEQASNQSTNLYRHIDLWQGHTVGGQLLGSLAGYGGGGTVLALDTYTPGGRWSVDYTRTRLGSPRTVRGEEYGVNLIHSLGGEVIVFRGGSDLVGRLRASRETNRYPGESVFNVTAELGARIGF
ncbi:MAG TPA: hypothetical protein VLK84_23760, partial [Longimicrobium sp.]|nr:hypothetical protein [Longimicrobium sp.]